MTTQLAIYSGQLVWACGSSYPYWPSIICASESGHITNRETLRKPSVHVKLCANRKSDWIHLDDVFEFTGYDSYAARKRSMKSTLSKDDFHKAFDAANTEGWRKAVVEATYILSKDVDSRLGIFDTLNILDEISFEFNKIASSINFEDTNAEPLKITKPAQRRLSRIASLPPVKASSNGRRSEPQKTTEESKSRARRSLPASKPSKQPSKFETFEIDVLTYQMDSHPKEILFRDARVRNVCKVCCSMDDTNDGDLVKCSACGDHVHNACLHDNGEDYVQLSEPNDPEQQQQKRPSIKIRIENKVLCHECQPPSICFACKEITDTQLKKCDVKSCSHYYHTGCLDSWKQVEFVASKLKCPLHVCHTCFPIGNDRTMKTNKFTFCIKCPTVYHLDSCCIPAGTIIVTQKQHICIRHRSESRRSVLNLDWCVRCGEEDNALICCGSCPKTFHISCLDASEVSDPFLCEDCVNANNPLYGQMIIAKYGIHPWWPAVIVPTFKIPAHMLNRPPKEHAFCIRFFGDYKMGWIQRSSVHFYSKSEAAKFLTGSEEQANAFKEAANWFDKIMNRDNNNNNNSSNSSSESASSISTISEGTSSDTSPITEFHANQLISIDEKTRSLKSPSGSLKSPSYGNCMLASM